MGLYRPDTKDREFNKGGQAHHYGRIFFREKPYLFGIHHRIYRGFDNDGQLGATQSPSLIVLAKLILERFNFENYYTHMKRTSLWHRSR